MVVYMRNRIFPSVRAFLILLMFPVFLTSCGDWSLSYSETAKYEGWDIALDKDHSRAFAAAYRWDGDMSEEGRRVVIPETVEGCTVKKLGGYFGRGLPMPFSLSYYSENPDGTLPVLNEEDPEPLVFTLVVNRSLSEIENVRMGEGTDGNTPDRLYRKEEGGLRLYEIYWRAEADEGNQDFYVKNGRLYGKKGDRPVIDFFWAP